MLQELLKQSTTLLLTKGWSGSWIEGSQEHIKEINKKFNSLINNGKLSIKNAFITAENHYEPPRYFLLREPGHPTNFGDFESV